MDLNFESVVAELAQTIQKEASVRAVFGEPIKLDQHTIVPVALVTMGFGAGGGGGRARPTKELEAAQRVAFGGGGGLDVKAIPMGFIHEDNGGVRFTPIDASHVAADGNRALGRILAALKR